MATKRTPIGRPQVAGRITDEMVQLYRRGRAIEDADQDEISESEGGRGGEFSRICVRLHSLLGRKPWQTDVFSTRGHPQPPKWVRPGEADSWLEAIAIRAELEQAAHQAVLDQARLRPVK
jgi:hypothetical protein